VIENVLFWLNVLLIILTFAFYGACAYFAFIGVRFLLRTFYVPCADKEKYSAYAQALDAAFHAEDSLRPSYCSLCFHWHNYPAVLELGIDDLMERQRTWSTATFGEGLRTLGNTKHIEKEIAEIRENPTDTVEWIDVILLGIDGYWRAGGNDLFGDLVRKQNRNTRRKYPKTPQDVPSQHEGEV
jgi:hypothetical protein